MAKSRFGLSPSSAVTLSYKRDAHNEQQYGIAGSMNINTDAAWCCREGGGTETKTHTLDKGQPD